jgi:ABC-2 type transport system permease protein
MDINYIGVKTLVWREVKRFLTIWIQTIVPPLISASLYIVIFGRLLGERIQEIGGVPYIDFIVPGILMMNVISSSFANTSSSIYIGRFQNNIQELLVSPLSYLEIVLGFVFAGMLRGVIIGLGIYAIAIFFTAANIAHFFAFLYFLFVTALLFSALGAVVGLWAKSFDHINLPVTFILVPLSYMGGVFHSLSIVPQWLATISEFNIIFYMVNGIRYSMIGISDVPLVRAVLIVGLLTIVAIALCVHLFKRGYNLRS